ncbi:MAG TPA: hypothetical protein V6D04_08300 [Candidatus Obscuribacterales bacterium]
MPELHSTDSDLAQSQSADVAAIASKPRPVLLPSLQCRHRSKTNLVQLLALSFQVTLLFTASASILYGLLSWPSSALPSRFHPAQIPWLTTQDGCEHTGRTWQQDHCFDYDHNPLF